MGVCRPRTRKTIDKKAFDDVDSTTPRARTRPDVSSKRNKLQKGEVRCLMAKLYTRSLGIMLLFVVLTAPGVDARAQTISRAGCGTWRLVSSPHRNGSINILSGVAAVSPTDVWAVGLTGRSKGSGQGQALIEHWNGVRWAIINGPHIARYGGSLSSVAAVSSRDIWAVGQSTTYPYTLIEHWNGVRWSIMPAPRILELHGNAFLTGVTALSSGDLWTVGASATATLAEHWNGVRWVKVPSPSPMKWGPPPEGENTLFGVSGSSASDVWAVGDFWPRFGPTKALIEHWNGGRWMRVKGAQTGASAQSLDSVSSLSSDDVWAVGSKTVGDTGSPHSKPLVEHWNGTRWLAVSMPGTPHGQGSWSSLGGVAALSPTNVWAVGGSSNNINQPEAPTHPVILHWNGQAWRRSETPVVNSSRAELSEISGTKSSLWAVGFSGLKGEQTALIEHRVGC
jgi:hypothetical protein